MRRTTTIIQRAQKGRLKMIGARKPGAASRPNGPWTGFDDRGNATRVEKRVVILHGMRKLTEFLDRIRGGRTLIQDYPHDQIGRQSGKARALLDLVQANRQAVLVHSIQPSCQLMA
jgi:hypothetical protein